MVQVRANTFNNMVAAVQKEVAQQIVTCATSPVDACCLQDISTLKVIALDQWSTGKYLTMVVYTILGNPYERVYHVGICLE